MAPANSKSFTSSSCEVISVGDPDQVGVKADS